MKDRTNPDRKKDGGCPAKEKLQPEVATQHADNQPMGKGGYGTGPVRNPDGAGFINPPTKSQQARLDATNADKEKRRKKPGKETDGSLNKALEKADEMKSGDIFLKHDDDPESTHIAVRKDNIILATADGLTGVKVAAGEVTVQGELIIKNSGSNITKGWFTENSLSFLPSTLYTEIPGYLFKLPISGLLKGVTGMLKSFIGDFYKG